MRLEDRQIIEGTNPAVYIGRRVYRNALDERIVANTYTAEYCLDGKQRHLSLGTTNKQTAIAKVWEQLSQFKDGHAPTARRRVTMAEVFEPWLENHRNCETSSATIIKYEYAWGRIKNWLGKDGKTMVLAFDEPSFWSYRAHLKEKKLSDRTIYTELTIIKQAVKWGARQRIIAENTLSQITLRKPELTPQPHFKPAQISTLLTAAEPRLRPLFAVLAYAGLRVGEATSLIWANVVLPSQGQGFITVRSGGSTGKTKTRRSRRIPISNELAVYLRRMKKPGDGTRLVFTAHTSVKHPSSQRPLNERRLLVSLKRLCGRCGFHNPDQYKLHSFRHTFASMCAAKSIPQQYALEWMGHRSSEILAIYYHQFDDTAHSMMKRISFEPTDAA